MWAKAILELKLEESYFWNLSPLEFRLLEEYHSEQKAKDLELSRDISVNALVAVEEGKATGRLRLRPLFKKQKQNLPKIPIEQDVLAIAEAIKRRGEMSGNTNTSS
ncbi:MAG: hypothetical protein ACRDD4_08795 [Culicoidibacterales bacterium]